MSKTCDVCGSKIGLLDRQKISNGYICFSCSQLSSSYQTETVNNIKQYFNENQKRKKLFSETQILKNLGSSVVHIDNNHKLFFIGKTIHTVYYSFDEILNYGYDVTTTETTTKKKGGITRAIVGGAIAGPAGALVGSSTAKSKSVTTNQTTFYINLKTYSRMKKVSLAFPPKGFKEFADKCISDKANCPSNNSITDKLKTITDLKQQGIITEEEFQNKKKELLNQL